MTKHPFCPYSVRLCGVKVRREHVKIFLVYAGAIFMVGDAGVAIAHSAFHIGVAEALELTAGTTGKVGAAMAGAGAFFERVKAAM
jgi:hypothetical protein